jgi:hypothetical protein
MPRDFTPDVIEDPHDPKPTEIPQQPPTEIPERPEPKPPDTPHPAHPEFSPGQEPPNRPPEGVNGRSLLFLAATDLAEA